MTWRRALRNFLNVVLVFLVLGVGWTFSRLRTDGLADRLAETTRAIAQARPTRPSHVASSLGGTFGEHAHGPLVRLGELLDAAKDAELCRAVREGEEPFTSLTPGCLQALEDGKAAERELLLATHAESPGAPAGLGTFDAPDSSGGEASWAPVGYAAKLAVLDLRQRLASGDRAGAVQTCVDLLALGRDVSWGTSLPGREAGVQVTERAFPACVAALDRAPKDVQEKALAQLDAIQQGLPPLDDTVRSWTTVRLLQGFGQFLGRRLATLPAAARRIVAAAPARKPFSPWETFLLKDYWHRYQSRMDAYVEAAQSPPPSRFDQLELVRKPEPHSFNPLARMPYPDVRRELEAEARSRSELLMLRRGLALTLARERSGVWPSLESLPESLRPHDATVSLTPLGAEARLEDRSVPRGELTLTLHASR